MKVNDLVSGNMLSEIWIKGIHLGKRGLDAKKMEGNSSKISKENTHQLKTRVKA